MVTDRDKEIAELKETLHLLKSPANAERLQSAVKSIEAGDTVKKELFE
jgi:PHD/YefM family antitoxin component YafN of YafNO toxin-antitoxin module